MSSRLSLLNHVSLPAPRASGMPTDAVAVKPTRALVNELAALPTPTTNRHARIWELHHSLHCSIIGTCLTTVELRRVLVRLKVEGAETAGDHDLHTLGVMLAGRPRTGAKALQKALDRRHRASIGKFAKAKTPEAVSALWEDALKTGDIPGAYWALLTHPVTTNAIISHAFGDVHMLSHLVGAANRTDIRRLRELEAENTALAAKIERQQRQLRDGLTVRDATIRRLNELLGDSSKQRCASMDAAQEGQLVLQQLLANAEKRLATEAARRKAFEQKLGATQAALANSERLRANAERERDDLQRELTDVESKIGHLLGPDRGASTLQGPHMFGRRVLYVGGRSHQVPQFRTMIERAGGDLLHHDGGIEHGAASLSGLLSRADVVLFPVDCISHDAVATIKRSCQQLRKRYVPLRTASLTCLLSTLISLEIANEPACTSSTTSTSSEASAQTDDSCCTAKT
jgi:hypothetical protein